MPDKGEREEIQVEALVDEAVQHPAPARDRAAERLQQHAEPPDVHAEGGGQVLVHKDRGCGPAKLRMVEAMDEESDEDQQSVQDGKDDPPVGRGISADIGQAEHAHGPAYCLEVLDDGAGDEDECEPDDHHGECGGIPDEKRNDVADDPAEGKSGEQGPSERHVERHHEPGGRVA